MRGPSAIWIPSRKRWSLAAGGPRTVRVTHDPWCPWAKPRTWTLTRVFRCWVWDHSGQVLQVAPGWVWESLAALVPGTDGARDDA